MPLIDRVWKVNVNVKEGHQIPMCDENLWKYEIFIAICEFQKNFEFEKLLEKTFVKDLVK